jgi:Phytanoyl-CoA dioxygenase (PhyH)
LAGCAAALKIKACVVEIKVSASVSRQAGAVQGEAAERRRQFERDGFVVARHMFSGAEMREFIAECHSFEGKSSGPDSNDAGEMRFYNQLFRKSEVVRRFVTQQSLIDFMAPITGPDLWMRWDQAVAKGPGSGVFNWHTDAGYDLLPQPHFEVWIALSESRRDNGGLCVIPGSHRRGHGHRHRRIGTHMVAEGHETYDRPDSGKTVIEAEAGDVILFSSALLHKTYENTTARARWAYVGEFMKLGDYDPTSPAPYFVAARQGRSAGEFVDRLPGARDPVQILRTLPLALRKNVAGPLLRAVRAALTLA